MQDAPLLISDILRHGQQVHGDSTVITVEAGGFRSATFAEVAERAERLAAALTRLGVQPGDRVGTFCWNNQQHLEAYLAIPCMGAVLHTLNIRLSDDQIEFIVYDAEDRVVIVDMSLAVQLAGVLPRLETVRTVIAVGEGDIGPLRAAGKEVLRYDDLLAGQPTSYDWPDIDERAAAAMCYTSGTTGHPKGVVYGHRSSYLHSMAVCSTNGMTLAETDTVLPAIPMFHANGWGLAIAALLAGADLVLPNRFLQGDRLLQMIEGRRVTLAAAGPETPAARSPSCPTAASE